MAQIRQRLPTMPTTEHMVKTTITPSTTRNFVGSCLPISKSCLTSLSVVNRLTPILNIPFVEQPMCQWILVPQDCGSVRWSVRRFFYSIFSVYHEPFLFDPAWLAQHFLGHSGLRGSVGGAGDFVYHRNLWCPPDCKLISSHFYGFTEERCVLGLGCPLGEQQRCCGLQYLLCLCLSRTRASAQTGMDQVISRRYS
jgi:hypothetical protein